jgi:hypothetical protein
VGHWPAPSSGVHASARCGVSQVTPAAPVPAQNRLPLCRVPLARARAGTGVGGA